MPFTLCGRGDQQQTVIPFLSVFM